MHALRPSAPFLRTDGELARLVADLDFVQHNEGWQDDDCHEVRLLAHRP